MLPAILDAEMASYNTQNHCSMLFLHHPFLAISHELVRSIPLINSTALVAS